MTNEEAIKELTKFVELKTSQKPVFLSVITEAVNKRIPKKPNKDNYDSILCPNCKYDMMGGIEVDADEDPKYCWKCGQAIDWR